MESTCLSRHRGVHSGGAGDLLLHPGGAAGQVPSGLWWQVNLQGQWAAATLCYGTVHVLQRPSVAPTSGTLW